MMIKVKEFRGIVAVSNRVKKVFMHHAGFMHFPGGVGRNHVCDVQQMQFSGLRSVQK